MSGIGVEKTQSVYTPDGDLIMFSVLLLWSLHGPSRWWPYVTKFDPSINIDLIAMP